MREKSSDDALPPPLKIGMSKSLPSSFGEGRAIDFYDETDEKLYDHIRDLTFACTKKGGDDDEDSRVVEAISALVTVFSQLSFTSLSLRKVNVFLAKLVFQSLVDIAGDSHSVKARLTALQFLMRLRANQCHQFFFTNETPSQVAMLSGLIHRKGDSSTISPNAFTSDIQLPLWSVYEVLPFSIGDTQSDERLRSYHPGNSDERLVLPMSSYLNIVVRILEQEVDWEVLSFVLCHLPVQLSNKDLFCDPDSKSVISRLLTVVCSGILSGGMASQLSSSWPQGRIKARDAHGLAYHTLSVLLGYRHCFDLKQCHLLVEVFQHGLNGQIPVIKCCLHSLSLAAFELQVSMTKYLPCILEMLSQIMSNATMTVHILSFLSVVVCLPPLFSNFTENDFKMVFGVALQYLQQYNQIDCPTPPWALSQYVRILAYFVVYHWFFALKQPDRGRHLPFIRRQLLLANEGRDEVDDPTEVCLDWLSRYTHASAEPRPSQSVYCDVLNKDPRSHEPSQEKTWIIGHSVVTIRPLTKRGWIEILCRRPSSFMKFLCCVENACQMEEVRHIFEQESYGKQNKSYYPREVVDPAMVAKFVGILDRIPVIDTHKVGILYVAPGQKEETEILRNTGGSPSYTRFLEGLGSLINLRAQVEVYAGGLDPDEDGEYAYAWWDDIGQILYHTATMMPTTEQDLICTNKKRHIGNDYVRIVWNDSGLPYQFDTLSTQFQFVNIVIEPNSLGLPLAFSGHAHEPEFFKVTVQRALGMPEFAPVGHFKLLSSNSLPIFVRQLSLLADWFASVFAHTHRDTERVEMKTNWRVRLESIRRFRDQVIAATPTSNYEKPVVMENLIFQPYFR